MAKIDKSEILRLINKYEKKIEENEKMIEQEPESLFWYEDYNLNSNMLDTLREELKKC